MRYLLWFSVGVAVACVLGVWILPVGFLLLSAVVSVISAVLMWIFGFRKTTVVLIGCCMGLLWYFGFLKICLEPARSMDGSTITTVITATDYSYKTDYGIAVKGEFTYNGITHKICAYLNTTDEIHPGDTFSGTVKLRYTAPGGQQDPTYHAGNGVLFLGYQRGSGTIAENSENDKRYIAAHLRHLLCERLDTFFREDTSAFSKALLLGEDSDLDYATDSSLKISGIRHIIAVSGLHVAILFGMLQVISLNRRFLTALLGLPVLALFCAVAGFTPSVTRACIMVGLMMVAQLFNREYDSASGLAFAALVMLIKNPLVITSISFQMSFLCVAGILLFQEPIAKWLQEKLGVPEGKSLLSGLKRWLISSVSVSLSAIVLTTPVAAGYFGTVSLVGVLANLLTLWAVSLAFYGIVAVCLLSFLSVKAAAALALLAELPMRYVLYVAKVLSELPLAAVYMKSIYIILWLIFAYILLNVFLRSEKRSPLVLSCCAVLGLCAALLLSWAEYGLADTHLTALDVGQGQSLILQHRGKTFLIDCGGSNDELAANTAVETLLSRGITRLDGIILTHADRDHAGGIPHLLTRIDSDFLMLPSGTSPDTLAQLTEDWNGDVILVEEDLLLQVGGAEITVFGPEFVLESNENSLCILFESRKCAILVTGDRGNLGEMLLMHDVSLPDVDLLIAGHHGSRNSTSEELLKTVQPETVFISVGKNSYGHPAQELLDRLSSFGCEIYRTDLHGTLIFRR